MPRGPLPPHLSINVKQLRALLKEAGLKNSEFAAFTGKAPETVATWMMGKKEIPSWAPAYLALYKKMLFSTKIQEEPKHRLNWKNIVFLRVGGRGVLAYDRRCPDCHKPLVPRAEVPAVLRLSKKQAVGGFFCKNCGEIEPNFEWL